MLYRPESDGELNVERGGRMFGRVRFMILMGIAGIVFGVLAMSFVILTNLYGGDLGSSDPENMIVQLENQISQLEKRVTTLSAEVATLRRDVVRLEQSNNRLWEELRPKVRLLRTND